MSCKIKKIIHPYPWELLQTRIDQSIITGQPIIERPFWYENIDTGQLYYDLYGCIGWPTEISDVDKGLPGYLAIVGVVKPKTEGKWNIADAPFRLLAEQESRDVSTMLNMMLEMRNEWGFGLHPDLLSVWRGDYERYITTIALFNERLTSKEIKPILIAPPNDFDPQVFDEYGRALQSVLQERDRRFYWGGNNGILRNKLLSFTLNDPAVLAIGGLVHTMLGETMWADLMVEAAFTIEGEGEK